MRGPWVMCLQLTWAARVSQEGYATYRLLCDDCETRTALQLCRMLHPKRSSVKAWLWVDAVLKGFLANSCRADQRAQFCLEARRRVVPLLGITDKRGPATGRQPERCSSRWKEAGDNRPLCWLDCDQDALYVMTSGFGMDFSVLKFLVKLSLSFENPFINTFSASAPTAMAWIAKIFHKVICCKFQNFEQASWCVCMHICWQLHVYQLIPESAMSPYGIQLCKFLQTLLYGQV